MGVEKQIPLLGPMLNEGAEKAELLPTKDT